MRVIVVLALALTSCASRALAPARVAITQAHVDHDDEGDWVDLDTMSVDLFTGRIRGRVAPAGDALVDGRVRVTTTRRGTVVRDLEQHNSGYTLHESVRWIGGYMWSSGDVLVSSDKRLARVELSAEPRYVGWIVWELPPLEGTLGTATTMRDHIAFANYEPSGDGRVDVAVVHARGDEGWRETIDTMPCSYREVRVVEREPRDLVIVVACAEGATIEKRDWRDKLQPLEPRRQ